VLAARVRRAWRGEMGGLRDRRCRIRAGDDLGPIRPQGRLHAGGGL